jgi:hypothetical protein
MTKASSDLIQSLSSATLVHKTLEEIEVGFQLNALATLSGENSLGTHWIGYVKEVSVITRHN